MKSVKILRNKLCRQGFLGSVNRMGFKKNMSARYLRKTKVRLQEQTQFFREVCSYSFTSFSQLSVFI